MSLEKSTRLRSRIEAFLRAEGLYVASVAFVVWYVGQGLFEFSWWWNHDGIATPLRFAAFLDEWRHGHFHVRWLGMFSGGYGSPFFHFYGPLYYYVAGALRVAGLDFLDALKVAILLFRFAGAFSIYALGRRRFGPVGGWCAALAFAVAPYQNATVFVRGAFTESVAMNLFAVALWRFDAALVRRRTGGFVSAAAAYACVVVAHPITGYLGGIALAVWALGEAALLARWRVAARGVLVLLFAAGLSAFYWIPAIGLLDCVHPEALTSGGLRWENWTFVAKWSHAVQGFRHVGSDGDMPKLSYAVGDFILVGAAAALVAATLRRRRVRGALTARRYVAVLVPFVLLTFGLLFFVTADVALWLRVPYLRYIQFPYRVLSILTGVGAVALGAVGWFSPRRARRIWPMVLFATVLATAIPLYRGPLSRFRPTLDGDDVRVNEENMERILRETYVTANTGNEYLPRQIPLDSPLANAIAPKTATLIPASAGTVHMKAASREKGMLELDSDALVRWPVYWFPGWRIEIDGKTVESETGANGLLQFRASAGSHTVTVRRGYTKEEAVGLIVSGLTAILLMALWRRDQSVGTRRTSSIQSS